MQNSLLSASPPVLRTGRGNPRIVPRAVGSSSGNSSLDDSYSYGDRRASFEIGNNNSVPFGSSSRYSAGSDFFSSSSASSNKTVTGFESSESHVAAATAFLTGGSRESRHPEASRGSSRRGLLSIKLNDPGKAEAECPASQALVPSQWDLSTLQKRNSVWSAPCVVLAYELAAEAHAGQVRKNGDPVLAHCVETARILSELDADEVTIAAALLHDVVDDTAWTQQMLDAKISVEVADLVRKVSKMSYISQLARNHRVAREQDKSAKLRDMLMAATDCRAVLIKLADRLHNLRTISGLPFTKQVRIAEETMEVFVPLAGRLGCWTLKSELEDLCFRIQLPQEYKNLKAQYDEFISDRESSHLSQVLRELKEALDKEGIKYEDIAGRPKNLYGVYKKMQKRRVTQLTDVFDLLAMRVVVPDKLSCYMVLRKVHELWPAWEGRFKDYIRNPKPNGYQSIHDVVTTQDGVPFEVQIRTNKMHYIAENGVAAHWRYKENGSEGVSQFVEAKIIWARYLLSYMLELNDKKCRPQGGDVSSQQGEEDKLGDGFSLFKDRAPNFNESLHHASHIPRPVSMTDFWDAPVYIALRTCSGLEVCEVPQDCTIEDFLLEHADRVGNMLSGMPMVNGELACPDQLVKFGDLIEISTELSKKTGVASGLARGREKMDMYCLNSPTPILVNANALSSITESSQPNVMGEGLLKAFVPRE